MQSAQQVWLAGLGALASAQEHGEQMLDELIRRGADLEQTAREFSEHSLDEADKTLEQASASMRNHSRQAWSKLEQAFEDRVSDVLSRLGVPARREMDLLMKHVEELNQQVKKLRASAHTRFDRTLNTGMRRARDDLSDLARELEEVQLAAKRSMKQGISDIKKAIKDASR